MVRLNILKSFLVVGMLVSASTLAYADCEADLGQLEKAMAVAGIKPDQTKALQAAGEKASSALRKDDDATCRSIIVDALRANGTPMAADVVPVDSGTGLGDLSAFRTIASDTLKLAQASDNAGAKKRITDIETAWDKAHATLKAKNAASWTAIDDSLDAALKATRASTPDAKATTTALTALIAMIDKTK